MAVSANPPSPRRRRRVWVVVVVVLAVLAAAAAVYWFALRPRGTPAATAEAATLTVALSSYQATVSGPGTLQPIHAVSLTPDVSGRLTDIVSVGDRVSKGETLARLDPTSYQRAVDNSSLALQKAEAGLAALQASQAKSGAGLDSQIASLRSAADAAQRALESQQRDTQLTQTLYDMGSASTAELRAANDALVSAQEAVAKAQNDLSTQIGAQKLQDDADTQDLRTAQLAVEQAKLTLTNAQQDLAGTTVVAPFDGVVSAVTSDVGEMASSGGSSAATALLTLVDDSRLAIDVQIDESDIADVHVGQDATVTVDARPDLSLPAKVTQIAPTATLVSNIPVFYVTVEIDNSDGALRGGMTGNAEIVTRTVQDTFAVPSQAVVSRNGTSLVRVQQPDGSYRPVPVTAVGSQGLDTVLTGNVPDGAVILVSDGGRTSNQTGTFPNNGSRPGGFPLGGGGGPGFRPPRRRGSG